MHKHNVTQLVAAVCSTADPGKRFKKVRRAQGRNVGTRTLFALRIRWSVYSILGNSLPNIAASIPIHKRIIAAEDWQAIAHVLNVDGIHDGVGQWLRVLEILEVLHEVRTTASLRLSKMVTNPKKTSTVNCPSNPLEPAL